MAAEGMGMGMVEEGNEVVVEMEEEEREVVEREAVEVEKKAVEVVGEIVVGNSAVSLHFPEDVRQERE